MHACNIVMSKREIAVHVARKHTMRLEAIEKRKRSVGPNITDEEASFLRRLCLQSTNTEDDNKKQVSTFFRSTMRISFIFLLLIMTAASSFQAEYQLVVLKRANKLSVHTPLDSCLCFIGTNVHGTRKHGPNTFATCAS